MRPKTTRHALRHYSLFTIEELIRQGYAFANTAFTTQRMSAYCAAEAEARQAKAGVWALADSPDAVLKQFGSDKQSWLLHASHNSICKF